MLKPVIIIGCFAALAAEARNFNPAALPPSTYMDTEVVTNMPCVFDTPSFRNYCLSLALVGTPSNNVEVALGTDANGDGRLTFGEDALRLAWDCGEWIASGRGGRIVPLSDGPDTNGVVTAALDVTVYGHRSDPAWLYDRNWNLLRVTARGIDAPLERVHLETHDSGFAIIVK